MPRSSEPEVCRIAINGRYLDELRTRQDSSPGARSTSFLGYPVEQHRATEDAEGLTLEMPTLTALQLYEDGVLSADKNLELRIEIAGRARGNYYQHWLRLPPAEGRGDRVVLRLGRKPISPEAPHDPDAWLRALVPLKLFPQGLWDPAEEYWGEDGEPIDDWAKPIIDRGPRPMFEMEQILPGWDAGDIDSDPIGQAVDLRDSGKLARAKKLLEKLLIKDMRCLDAHAHLGNFVFDNDPESALLHYRRGTQIGQLALSADFQDVLSWYHIDNRPFLRCLSGLALCLWRLRQYEEAAAICTRLLWLSPSDNLGIRFILPRIKARRAWTPDE